MKTIMISGLIHIDDADFDPTNPTLLTETAWRSAMSMHVHSLDGIKYIQKPTPEESAEIRREKRIERALDFESNWD